MGRGKPTRTSVYARLEHAIDELHERLGGLPFPKESEFIWSDIWHLEAHHSTALEGNTLVLHEVATLLDQGRAVGAKPLREYLEVQGYGAAARLGLQPGRRPRRLALRRPPHRLRGPSSACPRDRSCVGSGAPR